VSKGEYSIKKIIRHKLLSFIPFSSWEKGTIGDEVKRFNQSSRLDLTPSPFPQERGKKRFWWDDPMGRLTFALHPSISM
jgi:hypothetical protein